MQIIAVADGSIIPAIITDHMIHMSPVCWPVHAEVVGIAKGDPISLVRKLRHPR